MVLVHTWEALRIDEYLPLLFQVRVLSDEQRNPAEQHLHRIGMNHWKLLGWSNAGGGGVRGRTDQLTTGQQANTKEEEEELAHQ